MHESRETSGYLLNSRTCRTNVSFVAKKKEEECELHGAGGVVHRQVFQVASEVVGGLVPSCCVPQTLLLEAPFERLA